MTDEQSQKAGAHSQQLQVAGDLVVVQGVTEERAREIAVEAAHTVLAEYSDEAREVGANRVEQFDETFVGALVAAGELEALRDPAFQVLLRKAQLGAASTDRVSDYEMLAQLLTDRATRDARPIRASIDRAVQIVDLIDDSALTGLTVDYAVDSWSAMSGDPDMGLNRLDELFAQLLVAPLPVGDEWVDHLDTLDACRALRGGISSLKKMAEYYGEKMPGYVCQAVAPERDADLQARIVEITGGPRVVSVEHVFVPGGRRLRAANLEALRHQLQLSGQLDADKIADVLDIASAEYKIEEVDGSLIEKLHDAIALRPSLGQVQDWWDARGLVFETSGVGKVLARANVKRLDQKGIVPPLPE